MKMKVPLKQYLNTHHGHLMVTAEHRLRPEIEDQEPATLGELRHMLIQSAMGVLQVFAGRLTSLPCPEARDDALLLFLIAEELGAMRESGKFRDTLVEGLALAHPEAVTALAHAVVRNAQAQHEGQWLLPPRGTPDN